MAHNSIEVMTKDGEIIYVTPTNRGYLGMDMYKHLFWLSYADARKLAAALNTAANYTESDTPSPHQAALTKPILSDYDNED